MSDFDPMLVYIREVEFFETSSSEFGYAVDSRDVPKMVAKELRRLYESHGDPSLYWLVLRAQEIESL